MNFSISLSLAVRQRKKVSGDTSQVGFREREGSLYPTRNAMPNNPVRHV